MEDRFAFIGPAVLFQPRRLGKVKFAADQRLDPLGLGLVVELDRPVEIAVVRERHGTHPQFLGPFHEPVDPAAAVEQAVVSVDVQMDEILVSGSQGP